MDVARYLRVEGVNIYANLADTNQLSVIRGGSFLLKDAIETIAEEERYRNQLITISTGASEGIFCLVPDAAPLVELIDDVATFLADHSKYRHLTFTVVGHEAKHDEEFQLVKKQLIVKSRFLQMQQLRAPADPDVLNAKGPCEVEGIRPQASDEKIIVNGEKKRVSFSVATRWRYGIEKRRRFYLQEAARAGDSNADLPTEYTRDIESLASHTEMNNLNDKVAVVYFDGNGFGGIQSRRVKSSQDQQAFDKAIKKLRATFLTDWLSYLNSDQSDRHFAPPSRQTNDLAALRFETLLWGGDEMLFVVPSSSDLIRPCFFEF